MNIVHIQLLSGLPRFIQKLLPRQKRIADRAFTTKYGTLVDSIYAVLLLQVPTRQSLQRQSEHLVNTKKGVGRDDRKGLRRK